jgi:uncharacterized protein DUF1559
MTNSPITRSDVILLSLALVMLGCLLFPALAQSGSNAELNSCMNNLKQIAIALQNHHDTRKAFPLASTQPIDHKPGSAEADSAAGYSWLTMLLPFMEQATLYNSVSRGLKENKLAFDPDMAAPVGGKAVHPAGIVVNNFLCPSFNGDSHVVEQDSDYKPMKDGALPAVSNYHALAGSHFFNAEGLGRLNPPDQLNRGYEGDGGIPFPSLVGDKLQRQGLSIRSFQDGTSNTLMAAESLEPAYSAWLDGQSTWLVAAWPGNKVMPTAEPNVANGGVPILSWSDKDKKTARVAVNLRERNGQPKTYLAVGRWSGSKERRYAASSNHPNVVGHAYADGHVEMISTNVDPNIYIQLVTRAGREVIPGDFKREQQAGPRPLRVPRPGADPPGRTTPSGGPIEVIADQWTSPIDWSPLALGDLRVAFPQLLTGVGFVPTPANPSQLKFSGRSNVFSSITQDRVKNEFRFIVADREAATALPKLYKQLRASLGDATTKELNSRPKRVTWNKEAKWTGGAATFEFILTEAADKEPASVVIRVVPAS